MEWPQARYASWNNVNVDAKCKRPYVSFTISEVHEIEVSRFSKNCIVQVTGDIHVEQKQRIKHPETEAHQAATKAAESAAMWKQQFDTHPWAKTLEQHRADVVNNIKLTVTYTVTYVTWKPCLLYFNTTCFGDSGPSSGVFTKFVTLLSFYLFWWILER
jgi:hypothetical protein